MRGRYTKFFLLAPALLIVLATTTYPLGYAFLASFREWRLDRGGAPGAFVGLANYQRALSDAGFINSVVVTLLFTALSVALSIVIGLAIALLLARQGRRFTVLRTLLIFPFAVSPVLKGFSFKFMLNPNTGVIDYLIGTLFPPAAGTIWLGDPFWAMFWLAMSEVWGWAPLIALMFIGALGAISPEIHEAAHMDGASTWETFWHITLPLLRPVLLIVTLLKAIFSLKMFDQVVAMTGGGPGRATQTLNYYVYQIGFRNLDMGYASALATVLVIVLSIFAMLYVRTLLVRRSPYA